MLSYRFRTIVLEKVIPWMLQKCRISIPDWEPSASVFLRRTLSAPRSFQEPGRCSLNPSIKLSKRAGTRQTWRLGTSPFCGLAVGLRSKRCPHTRRLPVFYPHRLPAVYLPPDQLSSLPPLSNLASVCLHSQPGPREAKTSWNQGPRAR